MARHLKHHQFSFAELAQIPQEIQTHRWSPAVESQIAQISRHLGDSKEVLMLGNVNSGDALIALELSNKIPLTYMYHLFISPHAQWLVNQWEFKLQIGEKIFVWDSWEMHQKYLGPMIQKLKQTYLIKNVDANGPFRVYQVVGKI